MKPSHITAWMLTAALMLARLLPSALQPGMFFDGVTWATIARNMAIGNGNLWHPVLFGPGCDIHEQPTLAFWLESLLFRLLGDHFWVEKLYSVIVAIATAWLIAATWRSMLRDRPALRDCSWLPVALWLCVPSWAWMYDSNLLENTLGLFALASVYALLRAAGSPSVVGTLRVPNQHAERADYTRQNPAWLAWTGIAAICLIAAVLSKGPVGLFPLATPVLIALTLRRKQKRRMLVIGEGLLLLFFLLLGLVLMLPGAHEFLTTYFHQQVVASLAGNREMVHSRLGRLDIVWRMAVQLIVPVLFAGGLIAWARRRAATGVAPQDFPKAELLFCLLTAASASLPIAISPKQSGHYAFPSYAFYALAVAMWCGPAAIRSFSPAADENLLAARNQRTHRMLRGLAIAGTACVLIATIFLAGRPHRDKDVYHDTLVVGRLVPRQSTIGIAADLSRDYPIQMYLARWDGVVVRPPLGGSGFEGKGSGGPAEYCLTSLDAPPPIGFTPMAADLRHYRLYERSATATDRVGLGDRPSRQ